MSELAGLPGADLVERGLADLARGARTVPALLVSVATAKLRRLGLDVPARPYPDAELELYRALAREDPAAAYGRYNSLLRLLVSFARALEAERARAERAARGPRPPRS